jgi:CubicO group peptidase (beta-lactamase class C family)
VTNGDVAWPTAEWPVAEDPEEFGIDVGRVSTASEELFGPGAEPHPGRGLSLALVVVHRGRIVLERYGRQPANLFHAEREITSDTPLISWSMAKSITHAMVGMLVDEGKVRLEDPVPIAQWKDDERRGITWIDLLCMRDGLDFVEDYVADASGHSRSDVIDMLFGSGADDVYAYARSRPLLHSPGSTWSYSSGTTNIICGLIGDLLGGQSSVGEFMRERIFLPLGMASAEPTFDAAGTFIGSSYVHATARDFARFGYLYLRGGEWAGHRILTEDWVNGAHRQHAIDPDTGHGYGQHWWTWNADVRTCAALGYEGQRTIVVPDRDLVVVHLGKWETSTQPFLDRMLTRVIESVPARSDF